MQPHQRLLLLPVVHRLLPAQRAMRHGLAELGQRVVGLRPLGQAATAVDEVAEHDQSGGVHETLDARGRAAASTGPARCRSSFFSPRSLSLPRRLAASPLPRLASARLISHRLVSSR